MQTQAWERTADALHPPETSPLRCSSARCLAAGTPGLGPLSDTGSTMLVLEDGHGLTAVPGTHGRAPNAPGEPREAVPRCCTTCWHTWGLNAAVLKLGNCQHPSVHQTRRLLSPPLQSEKNKKKADISTQSKPSSRACVAYECAHMGQPAQTRAAFHSGAAWEPFRCPPAGQLASQNCPFSGPGS